MHLNGTVQVNITEELRRELHEAALEITDYADLWLQSPQDRLGGYVPLELAALDPKGKELVLNLIGMIKDGMFI